MTKARKKGETAYSPQIEGAKENWHGAVRFDWTDGGLGIVQRIGWVGTKSTERVLLTPVQVRELVAFVRRCKEAK